MSAPGAGEFEGVVPKRNDLAGFVDREGRFRSWPVKPAKQQMALAVLAEKFERGRDYGEREVNDVLKAWHTFGDHTRLRRDLCDAGLLARTDDGSRYWRTDPLDPGSRL